MTKTTSTTDSRTTIAIVGSGPSGCFTAQALRKTLPHAEITVFDRLPVPYGLVRYGVAPDHQGTKAVANQFDRLFASNDVYFAGNVNVGEDVSVDDLRAAFDIVVLAVGAHSDRPLGIPGAGLANVYGSGSFTRFINDHPDEQHLDLNLGRRVAIVGNGNVAIDILRILIKPEDSFSGSDLRADTYSRLRTDDITHIHVVGRSPAHAAKFDPAMVKELSKIDGVRFAVWPEIDGDSADSRLNSLAMLSAGSPPPAGKVVEFHFGTVPERIEGDLRVQRLIARPTGGVETTLSLDVDSVITAIGFVSSPDDRFSREALHDGASDLPSGHLASGLYCTGWFHRGAQGTIAANRASARNLAGVITDALRQNRIQMGKPGRVAVLDALPVGHVDYSGWRRIDAAEIANTSPNRTRAKIRDRSEMLLRASQVA
ncbi:FAD-dependent oxidoreductase [Mycolicibacterium litorale]|uniref:FAD-dependent oxidoreductase n=1 Tax=Mycolicibacterium litorale TaxID=758802 RepID=UPI003CEB6194